MDSWGATREVEKVPTTRTERHTALYTECLRRINNLKEIEDAVEKLFGATQLSANVHGAIDLLVRLSRELKPDTRDHG